MKPVLFFSMLAVILVGNLALAIDQQTAADNRQAMKNEDEVALDAFQKQPIVNLPYVISKTAWTDNDEEAYSQFVHTFGEAVAAKKCGDATACMHNPSANIYAKLDPPGLIFYADCARLPYLLRAYFAYHNGLPFAYVTEVAISQKPYASLNDRDNELTNTRLDDSPYGNQIVSRNGSSVSASPETQLGFQAFMFSLMEAVSTRVLRVGPLTPGFDLSDVYPVKIDHEGIRPGTIVTATGHVMVVWNVNSDGSIRIIDGHPGSYVQEHFLNSTKLQRSRPDHGLGFYRFRPLRLEDSSQGPAGGGYFGGKIVTATDEELYGQGKFSLQQWFGAKSDIKPGAQVDVGLWKTAFKSPDFFKYLTSQLRDVRSREPVDQAVKREIEDICKIIQSRQDTVNSNIAAGVSQRPHPDNLGADIFGSSDDDWEQYSTPGGDGRLKDEVRITMITAVEQFRAVKKHDKHVLFKGTTRDYVKLINSDLRSVAGNCDVKYVNSSGTEVTLTFNQVLARLNRLSFDPYMCVEKQWGASDEELSTCKDQDAGNSWYDAEQFIRNTVGKQNSEGIAVVRSASPITLPMLQDQSLIDQPDTADTNLGTKALPAMDLDKYFKSPVFLQALKDAH